ncbi:hypothetical protein [Planctomicrobium piriforme]|uniref:Uncharacterized protein n=1 Tax=Planctomicrobium piriforme TaxID=1576369 RepID=A0A1I3LS44_9PLAN|nr:hypothetical protein [Planctomicrobium piriforme]SFI87598.1 hypothetical protein SAMN05421753_11351 [Planctomicrobium piriforme]
MPPRRKHESTPDELAQLVREIACDEGGYVSFHRFRQLTGVPHSEVYRHYLSWDDLLAAAEIEKPQRSGSRFTSDQLLAEFHRVVEQLWKLPTVAEFTRHARISWGPIWTTFNGHQNLLTAYRQYLDQIAISSPSPRYPGERAGVRGFSRNVTSKQAASASDPLPPDPRPLTSNPSFPSPDSHLLTPTPSRDNPWVRHQWTSLRLGFEWLSSDFPLQHRDKIDILICWKNDFEHPNLPTIELSTAAPWLEAWIDHVEPHTSCVR